ncbi:hypothetical protein FGIG_02284 [Fasciola gigantica]|uniref:Uncharacterized protein n=1 Tax=Fasciola gigantica TaxID=46835 RepID=A0A504YYI2_FASGI|nr:hypothetical protein FGIG_02284 [Fasciola gigantica]
MSVVSILNPVHSSNLPLSVENCSTNITILPPSNVTASAPANSWSIYSLSYLYYSLVCFLTATVVGLVVSALSGFNTRTPVSTRLLAKQAVAVYSRMPNWLPPQTFQDHSCGNDVQINPICGAVDRLHHKNTYLVHAVAAYTPDKSRSFCQAVS